MVKESSRKGGENLVASGLPACVGLIWRQQHALSCTIIPSHVVRTVSDRPKDELYGPAVDIRRKGDLLHLWDRKSAKATGNLRVRECTHTKLSLLSRRDPAVEDFALPRFPAQVGTSLLFAVRRISEEVSLPLLRGC